MHCKCKYYDNGHIARVSFLTNCHLQYSNRISSVSVIKTYTYIRKVPIHKLQISDLLSS